MDLLGCHDFLSYEFLGDLFCPVGSWDESVMGGELSLGLVLLFLSFFGILAS